MASPYPTLNLPGQVSPDVYAPSAQNDVPGAYAHIAAAADQIGGALNGLAQDAAHQEGQRAAFSAFNAGQTLAPTDGTGAYDVGYRDVATRLMASQAKAGLSDTMAQAFAANPNDPAALAKSLDAAKAGLQSSGVPEVDAEVGAHWALLRGDYMAQAYQGAHKTLQSQAEANFATDLNTGRQTLDQVAAGAPGDGDGPARVGNATGQLIQSLSRYGPKDAFSLAGVDFPADPTRQGLLTPDRMAPEILKSVSDSRKTWILAQADQLGDPGQRRAFASSVMDRWQQGDPAFTGIDGPGMEDIQRRLEAGTDRQQSLIRQDQAQAGQSARGAIEAFSYGQDVDFDKALSDAQASGDQGLVGEVNFYKNADVATRGVLKSVVARQLGLIGAQQGPQPVVVDAEGQPVERGVRNNNPGNVKAVAGQNYLGQTGVDADGYAIFATPQAGVAQARTQLRLYGQRGLDTPQAIAAEWAPKGDGDNDPVAYAQSVADKLHVTPTTKLDMSSPAVVDGLANAMFGVETPKGVWSTPATVPPGSPAYVAWASAREGFTTDPLNYARGGVNRPAIANVPVLVPDGAFQQGAPAQAWGQAFAQRWSGGNTLATQYGVPVRSLTNGERDFYKNAIELDPMKGIALAQAARASAGPQAALGLMRELGENDYDASATLHIADLAAGGNPDFARRAAQGMQLQADGKAKPDPNYLPGFNDAFRKVEGSAPPPVLTAARTTALAAMVADQLGGVQKPPSYYVNQSLGQTSLNGQVYGGPANVNGATTTLPRWLSADHAADAIRTVGDLWAQKGVGPVWADGSAVTGQQLRGMRPALQPNGFYRFLNPRTGNPASARDGSPFEADLDHARRYIGLQLGAGAVLPGGG